MPWIGVVPSSLKARHVIAMLVDLDGEEVVALTLKTTWIYILELPIYFKHVAAGAGEPALRYSTVWLKFPLAHGSCSFAKGSISIW